ncbi:MAG: CHAT domain-containing protein [Spirirestis rafaelensis WJT71-NPBG6]|nr:CHAT domain-containing protein [Spirirestis rafaelensis WJT71-NPBG6]
MDNSDIPVKILFLAADPSDEARLRLLQELRDIRERLQLSKERDRFKLESRESVRVGDITQAIFDVDPQIVHFSGHGTSTGELHFESLQGKSQPVQADALAALFGLVAEKIDCVVLNACYSKIQAQAIAEHIRFVIGMNQAIGDKGAIAFSVGFYKALAANRSIEEAYKFGCVEIRLYNLPEHLKPVIYINPSPKPRVKRIIPNPFVPQNGRVEQPQQFFGRQREIQRVFEVLNSGSSVALIGKDGIGKSSLL